MNLLVDWKINNNIRQASTALVYKGEVLTYPELINKINSQALFLHNKGIKEHTLVPILSENNHEFIINISALWKIGAVPVPINTRFTVNEIEDLLKFVNSNFIITSSTYNENFRLNNYEVISNLSTSEPGKYYPFVFPSTEQTAVIIFTSGSSGKSKGVELTYNNLIKSALTGNQFLNQTNNDRWLASLPFYHIGGFSIIIRALMFGAAVIIPASLSTEDLCDAIKNEKPTLASLVSAQLTRLIDAGCKPNDELRNILLGGGIINSELINKALQNNWKVSKVYGSSETASMVTFLDCTKEKKLDSAGKVLVPNEIIIVDDENKVLPPNKAGQIIIKGPSVAKGYLNNPGETSNKFIDGYYYSGDIGWLDDEGFLFIEARRNDLIVSGGENVNPAEVEKEILNYPGIIEAAVFSIEDAEWGQLVAAAIVTTDNKELNFIDINEFLKVRIAGYKIPKRIYKIDELPKTALGKIQKEELKKLFSDY